MYSAVNTIWALLGAALVFFMQTGFSMCEAGFTRAKNTGNILKKNLMDFCIGTPCFWLVGFGLMFGAGTPLLGKLDPMIMGDYSHILPAGVPLWAFAIFQTVFCATSATIVSGAMAERTKFSAYCIYSAAISLLIYPISGHWIWGGGWLRQLGFHDFAGSTAVHMVGGICALIGAAIMGVIFWVVIVFAVEFFDKVAKIDDPVGAISIHCVCGALGTILTGLFVTGTSTEKGLFYGGGLHLLGIQTLGVVTVAVYVAVVITIVFLVIKHTIGLRADAADELAGLDVSEHGLLTAYAGFAMLPDTLTVDEGSEPILVTGETPVAEAIPVKKVPTFDDGTPNFTKVQVDIVVSQVPVRTVIDVAKKVLYTGHIGDGKIFVYDVENVVKVRTGEEGYDALQHVE